MNNENVETTIKNNTSIASRALDISKKALKIVVPIVAAAIAKNGQANLNNLFRTASDYTYSGAVQAVMDSGMWSADKNKAINALPKDADSEVYKAICSIANSGMWSADKLETIINMSKKEA